MRELAGTPSPLCHAGCPPPCWCFGKDALSLGLRWRAPPPEYPLFAIAYGVRLRMSAVECDHEVGHSDRERQPVDACSTTPNPTHPHASPDPSGLPTPRSLPRFAPFSPPASRKHNLSE